MIEIVTKTHRFVRGLGGDEGWGGGGWVGGWVGGGGVSES